MGEARARVGEPGSGYGARGPAGWQHSADGQLSWWGRTLALPQGQERWRGGRSREGDQQARTTLQRRAARERA
ncbi:MAG TPA: hypothetical protein VGS80_17925, partial [Ktedonobacterales bacterium]|nr:hypothetical protein [Ktedonobacterales bacterium]